MKKIAIKNVDNYISTFPNEIQEILKQVRNIILKADPNLIESISYGMPAYKLFDKPLVYFAAFKNHIGLYATPVVQQKFAKQLKGYKQGKGSIQFPIDKPLPLDLISQIVTYKIKR